MKTKPKPLTSVEWDTCWMAIRYAMNRRTAASASLPTELLAAYYDRWTDGQKEIIVRDLRDNLEHLKSWNETDEAYFGDKNIDHPRWMRFLLTLDQKTHYMVTASDGKTTEAVECIEFEGKYYPISGSRRWWEGAGELYVSNDCIVKVDAYPIKATGWVGK